MSKKSRILIILGIVLVAIVLLLVFSPILKSKPVAIEPGLTYQNTITLKDAPDFKDKNYRRHTYSLTVAVNTDYTFEVSSLSDDDIYIYEHYYDDRFHIIHVEAMGSGTADHHFGSAGLKLIYIEARTNELPADYSFRVTLIEGESP